MILKKYEKQFVFMYLVINLLVVMYLVYMYNAHEKRKTKNTKGDNMKQIKKAFLITMASAGLIGCERKLTKVYEMDQTGTVVVDSFVTEWPAHLIQNGPNVRPVVKDTAGVEHHLVPGQVKFEKPVLK